MDRLRSRPALGIAVLSAAVLVVVAGLGIGPASAVPSGTALRHLLVLPVNWAAGNGSPAAPQTRTANEIFALVDHNRAYYTEVSYGQFPGWHVTGLGGPEGLTISPPRMDAGNVCGSLFETDVKNGADAIAQNSGLVLSQFDAVLYYFSAVPQCPWGGLSSGHSVWLNNASEMGVFHELGHTLALSHGQALACWDEAGHAVALSGNCEVISQGDPHNIMGSGIGGLSAIMRFDVGWMNGRIVDVSQAGGSFTLEPLEVSTPGAQALRVTDGSTTLWLEYRQPIGLDGQWGSDWDFGILVYEQIPNVGLGSFLMDMTPTSSNGFRDAAMLAGTSWVDPLGMLRITVNSTSATAASVTIAPNLAVVPDIVGLNRVSAAGALSAAGLMLGYERDRVITDCSDGVGQVLSQTPAAGSLALIGTAVNFTFGVKPSGRLVCS